MPHRGNPDELDLSSPPIGQKTRLRLLEAVFESRERLGKGQGPDYLSLSVSFSLESFGGGFDFFGGGAG